MRATRTWSPAGGFEGTHLEFEGFCVVGAGDKVGVDPGSPAEAALVGAVLLQPQAVSLARPVGLAGHAT